MRRLVVFLLLLTLTGCGSLHIRGALNSGALVVSGLVSTVTISTVSDGRTIVTVTILTLQRSGPDDFTTTTFCGNHLSQFPLGSPVQVNFTPGPACSTILVIIVG